LAKRGARLALSARNEEKLRALNIADALILPCDATDVTSLESALRHLLAQFSSVDLVIYLAGDYVPMRADNFDLAQAEKVIAVNFLAAMRLTATVLPHLHAGGGIAFVASVAGYRGLPKALAYGPGKAALIHFAEVLHLDLAPKNMGVWVINPGFVATRLTAKNDFTMPALISPEEAATLTVDGLKEGKFEILFPKRFTRFMKLMALLPYRLYFPIVRRTTGG
jgi:short-subunit dehydrogenase